ncbi:MAG: ABC transporter substrate-binding protein [Chloroflexota bacterium]
MKTVYRILVVLMVVLAVASCTPKPTVAPTDTPKPAEPTPTTKVEVKATDTPKPAEPTPTTEAPPATGLTCEKPIKIGLITDLTGGLAIYGTMTERSFLLGMEYATGAPGTEDHTFMIDDCEVQVLIRDDKGSAETTATLARELIEVDDVDLLVGTVSSGSTATLQEIAKENETVLIVAPAAANDITGLNFNEYTFRTSRENYQDFINLCAYLTTQYDTFIQIAPDYSFGYGGAASARDACTFFGGEFVADDIYAPLDTTEFTPYMETIYNSGADAWIVTWAGAGFVPMFQTAAELGVLDDLGMGASFFDNRTMVAVFSPVADKMVGQVSGILYHYSAPDNAINDWLVQETKARHGTPPDLFDADGMNAAILAVEAIKATQGDMNSAALIAAMEGLEFDGPKGKVYIRPEDHVAIQDMYIVKLTNLTDPEFNIFELVETTRPEPPCLLPEAFQDRCGSLPIGSLAEMPEPEPEPTGLTCDEPVKVGLITDLTGGLAIYGTMTERSFLLGMEYGTGAPASGDNVFKLDDCEIQVLVRDDKGSAETTATLARELIEVDDVDLLVGTVSSGSTATLQEIAKENETVLIVAPAAANDITGLNFNEYTFRTSRENYQDFINLCAYLTTQYDTFIQIAPDYSFGYGGAASARDACTFFGGEFVADDIYAPLDTTEFTPYMETIYNSGADAWIVTWAGAGFVPMFQTAAELGVLDDLGMGASFFDNRTMVAVFSPVADKMVGQVSGILYHYSAPDNAINDWLVQETKARHGTPPDLFDADGMNAAILAVEAIKATQGDMNSAALIAAMEGLEFDGPKGKVYIRPEDHVAIQDMYIVKLTNLTDPEFNIFELVETTRPEPPCLLPEAFQDRCGSLPVGSLTGQ